MKRILLAVLALFLMIPSTSFAQGWRRPYYGRPAYRNYGYPGAAIAAGVLGGIATGIILDRALFPPVVYSAPLPPDYYPPPPPPPGSPDPYDSGYSEGYSSGADRGSYDRYEDGRRRGYQEGYDAARSGRGGY